MSRLTRAKASFGELIREMRQRRGEPLRVVAAGVSIDSTLLSKLERGERFPTEEQISRFSRFFKVSENELQGRVIADKVTAEYDNQEASLHAAQLLQERAAPFHAGKK